MTTMHSTCRQILLNENAVHVRRVDSVRKIGKGAWSVIYLASTDRGPFVLKIKLAGNDDVAVEYKNLKRIEGLHIAPKAYAHGRSDGTEYLIEEYIVGKRLTWRGISDKELLLVAAFFNTVHSKRYSAREYQWLKTPYWERTYRAAQKNMPQADIRRYRANIERVTELLKENKKLFEGKRTCVQRFEDPNPHNFIVNGNKLIAVDWAMSKPGHYSLDIADFFIKANLDERKKDLFLKHYRAPEKDFAQRIGLQVIERRLGLVTWHAERLTAIKNKTIKTSSGYATWHERFHRVLRKLERELEKSTQ
jgi:thiamine kinase-like enzyme